MTLLWLLVACTQGIPAKDGVPYGGTWLLTFSAGAERYFFRLEISGATEAGSYGESLACSAPDVYDAASARFAQIATTKLRVLLYDGKVIVLAGDDADGRFADNELSGPATYLSEQGSLTGTFRLLPRSDTR